MQPNESHLQNDVARATRAQALLDDGLLTEAFTMLECSYLDAWRTTQIDDTAGREKLFLAVNIIGKVRDHLATIVGNGAMAQRQLKQMADEITRAAERKRRFGIG